MTAVGRWLAIVVVGMLLLAGCSGGGGSTWGDSSPTPTPTPTAEPTTDRTPVNVRTTTETPTTESDVELEEGERLADNPWRKAPVVIGIADQTGGRSDYVNQVERAVRYWQGEGVDYATWEPEFVVRPDSDDPDIVIRFVEPFPGCGTDTDDHIVGCASLLQPDTEPNEPEVVLVHGNLTEFGTYATIRHELGHVLGLDHYDEPESVMSSRPSTQLDPAESGVYLVHVDIRDSITAKTGTREQVEIALEYYEDGAGGWIEQNVSFVEIDDPAEADIRIVLFVGDLEGSEGYIREGVIRVDTWDPTTRGWHVGYWLGFFLGAESSEDLPEPFNEPRTDDRREWW